MPLTFFETFFTLENSLLLFVILFFLRFPVLLAVENKLHAYEVKQKKVFWADATTAFFYTLIIFPLALQLSNWILTSPLHIPKVDSVPVAVRIFLYFVVGDFFHYWIHRLMHLQRFDNGAHAGADREVIRDDFDETLFGMTGQDPLQRIDQIKKRNVV